MEVLELDVLHKCSGQVLDDTAVRAEGFGDIEVNPEGDDGEAEECDEDIFWHQGALRCGCQGGDIIGVVSGVGQGLGEMILKSRYVFFRRRRSFKKIPKAAAARAFAKVRMVHEESIIERGFYLRGVGEFIRRRMR